MVCLYSKLRSEIKTGDLLIWKPGRINSFIDILLYLYQKIFKATYTHVGIALREGNRVFVIESTPPVLRLFPLSMTGNFYYIPVNLEKNEKFTDFLLSNLGKKYSLFDFVKSLFKLTNSNNDFYCSEFCGLFYYETCFIDNDEAGLTPDSLVQEIQKRTGKEPILVRNDKGNLDAV